MASSPTIVNLLLGKGTYTSSEEAQLVSAGAGRRGRWGGAEGQDRWFHFRQPAWMPGADGGFRTESTQPLMGARCKASSPLSVETPIWPLGPGPASSQVIQVLGLSATAPA